MTPPAIVLFKQTRRPCIGTQRQNLQNSEQSKVGQKRRGGARLESGNGDAPVRVI